MKLIADQDAESERDGGKSKSGELFGIAALSSLGLVLAWFTLVFGAVASSDLGDLSWLHAGLLGSAAKSSSKSIKDAVDAAKTPGALAEADIQAKGALAVQPLDTLALEALMTSAAKQKKLAGADQLAQLIVRRDARSTEAQLWLFGRGAAKGNYAESLSHADVVLRADQDLRPLVFSWVSALAADERAVQPLADLLGRGPTWRSGFLGQFTQSGADGRKTGAVLQALLNTSHPPTAEEVGPYLASLVTQQQYATAYLLWLQTLPPSALKQVALLYDPGFEGLPGAEPFNWALSKANGGYGEFETFLGGTERGLHVGYGGNISLSLARQVVLLTPGRYELSGRYTPDGAVFTDQFHIAVTCLPLQSGARLSDVHQNTEGAFTYSFEVPETGCSAQEVDFLGAPMLDPKHASAWYSHMRLSALNAGNAPN